MRVASNYQDDRAVLRGDVNFNTYRHTHTHAHRMTRMTGPDCAVIMCNLISTHTHTQNTSEFAFNNFEIFLTRSIMRLLDRLLR